MYATEFIAVPDGLKLAVRIYGKSDAFHGRPLICLPGLTRNARDFHALNERLMELSSGTRLILAIDSRGRGSSDRDPDPSRYTVPVEAGDVLAVMDAFGIAQADFIGTSRGGLILQVLASMAPERLGSLVFNDIGPVIGLDGMRHIQAYLDPAPRPRPRREILAGLKIVHGDAFPALAPEDWEEMVDCLYRPADTSTPDDESAALLLPDFDPAIAAAVKAMDLSASLPDLWPLFDLLKEKCMLVIRGEHSKLLSKETLEAMRQRHPRLDIIHADGQGHAPLLHVGELPAMINQFLAGN